MRLREGKEIEGGAALPKDRGGAEGVLDGAEANERGGGALAGREKEGGAALPAVTAANETGALGAAADADVGKRGAGGAAKDGAKADGGGAVLVEGGPPKRGFEVEVERAAPKIGAELVVGAAAPISGADGALLAPKSGADVTLPPNMGVELVVDAPPNNGFDSTGFAAAAPKSGFGAVGSKITFGVDIATGAGAGEPKRDVDEAGVPKRVGDGALGFGAGELKSGLGGATLVGGAGETKRLFEVEKEERSRGARGGEAALGVAGASRRGRTTIGGEMGFGAGGTYTLGRGRRSAVTGPFEKASWRSATLFDGWLVARTTGGAEPRMARRAFLRTPVERSA